MFNMKYFSKDSIEGDWLFKGYSPTNCLRIPKCHVDKILLKNYETEPTLPTAFWLVAGPVAARAGVGGVAAMGWHCASCNGAANNRSRAHEPVLRRPPITFGRTGGQSAGPGLPPAKVALGQWITKPVGLEPICCETGRFSSAQCIMFDSQRVATQALWAGREYGV